MVFASIFFSDFCLVVWRFIWWSTFLLKWRVGVICWEWLFLFLALYGLIYELPVWVLFVFIIFGITIFCTGTVILWATFLFKCFCSVVWLVFLWKLMFLLLFSFVFSSTFCSWVSATFWDSFYCMLFLLVILFELQLFSCGVSLLLCIDLILIDLCCMFFLRKCVYCLCCLCFIYIIIMHYILFILLMVIVVLLLLYYCFKSLLFDLTFLSIFWYIIDLPIFVLFVVLLVQALCFCLSYSMLK